MKYIVTNLKNDAWSTFDTKKVAMEYYNTLPTAKVTRVNKSGLRVVIEIK